MLANHRAWEGVQISIVVAMFITAAVRWSSVPDRIPIHWNAAGEVDGYGGKFAGLLLLPLIALALYVVLAAIPRFDPARANYMSFRGVYTLLRTGLMAYMGFVYLVLNLAINNEEGVPVGRILIGSVAGLLIGMGPLLGRLKPNYFAGIRTPWTLTSKKSWAKTHRLGGWVFAGSGVATGLAAIFSGEAAIIALFAVLFPGIVFLVIYSCRVWRTDTDRVAAQDTRTGPDNPSR